VWPWLVLLGLVLVGAAVVASASITVDYYAVSAGPVERVTDYVSVNDTDTFDAEGDLYFLTVVLEEVTLLQYLQATIDDEIDLRPRETIRPSGVTQEQLNRANSASMQESIERAIFVALDQLGYDATLQGDGALVVGLVDDSPAVGLLEENDIITQVNGVDVSMADQAVTLVSRTKAGERLDLTVVRHGDEGDPDMLEFTVVLGQHPDDDERGFIGVYLDTANLKADFPVDVAIDAGNIGGPSAGMMYTLGVMNILTEEDLTKGWKIAGTGTIAFDGDVGPIGGMRQKTFAARDLGAQYLLVPSENFEEASDAAGDDLVVISVDTFDDVIVFLGELEPAVGAAAAEG
jgi:PDZ domain-containing protein